MVTARFKPVPPDQRIREIRKSYADLQKEDPSVERAQRLAAFVREAHAERHLNMSMHAAQLCLEDDPDAPQLLINAFESDEVSEEHLRVLGDLEDLARYLERSDIREHAVDRIHQIASDWIRSADDSERRHRLRTLASMRGREFSDTIADSLR